MPSLPLMPTPTCASMIMGTSFAPSPAVVVVVVVVLLVLVVLVVLAVVMGVVVAAVELVVPIRSNP